MGVSKWLSALIFLALASTTVHAQTNSTVTTPVLSAPTEGSTLAGATQAIRWTPNSTSVIQWIVEVGTSTSKAEYFNSGRITNGNTRGLTLTGLPTDGSDVIIRLSWKLSTGPWGSQNFSFKAAGGSTTGTTTGSTTSDGSTTGSDDGGASTTGGTTGNETTTGGTTGSTGTGTSDGSAGTTTGTTGGTTGTTTGTTTGSSDGGTTTGSTTGGSTVTTPVITAPTEGGTLAGATQAISWTPNSTSVIQWIVEVGTTSNKAAYFNSGRITNGNMRNLTITGLPVDGSDVVIRLSWKLSTGPWGSQNFTYKAAGGSTTGSTTTGTTTGSTTSGTTTSGTTTSSTTGSDDTGTSTAGSSTSGDTTTGGTTGSSTDSGTTGTTDGTTDSTSGGTTTGSDDSGTTGGSTGTTAGSTTGSSDGGTTGSTTGNTTGGSTVTTPVVTAPAEGGTLAGATQAISWTPNSTSVIQWIVEVGTTTSKAAYFNSGRITNGNTRGLTLTGLPTDGSSVVIRLSWKLSTGPWGSQNFTYKAAGGSTTGSTTGNTTTGTTTGSTTTGTTTGSTTSSGSTTGSDDTGTSTAGSSTSGDTTTGGTTGSTTDAGTTTSGTTDGTTDSTSGGTTTGSDDSGTTGGSTGTTTGTTTGSSDGGTTGSTTGGGTVTTPVITAPTEGGTLTGATQAISWTPNSTSVIQWIVEVGTTTSKAAYFNSGRITNGNTRNLSITGLPVDGSDVVIRLSWKLSTGPWGSQNFIYKAAGGSTTSDTSGGTDGNSTAGSSDGGTSTGGATTGGTTAGTNTPPQAKAGAEQSITLGESVTLDGTQSSDIDGEIVSWVWHDNDNMVIGSGETFVWQPATAKTHTVTLIVTDDEGSADVHTTTIVVTDAIDNLPPTANAGDDQNLLLGESATLNGSASEDIDGEIVSWSWSNSSGTIIGSGESFTWQPDSLGTHVITLTVTDDSGDKASDSVAIQVEAPIQAVPDLANYEMAFNDEFNGSSLDPQKWDTSLLWGPYLPINNEEQMYVDTLGMHAGEDFSPFEFNGSTLTIKATAVSDSLRPPARPAADSPLWKPNSYSEYQQNRTVGVPGSSNYSAGYQEDDINYLSGIITSYGSFRMTHGYVETRAKLPAGRGLWPAFWLLPSHYVQNVPEIDVMEFLGHDPETVYHTYHYFDVADNWRKISTPSFTSKAADWTEQFHTYGMAWSPREIVWYVDGQEVRRITDSEYRIADQAMYLIANLAVGGSWPGSPDDEADFPASFEIDYIRAYKKKLSNSLNVTRDYQLMFADEFSGSSLDASKWNTHFLWGPYLPINNEEQYYVDALGSDKNAGPSPFTVGDGVLSITARDAQDPDGFPIPAALPDSDAPIWSDFPTFQQFGTYTPPNYTSGIITSYDSFKFAHGYAEIKAKIPKGDGLWPAFWLLNGYYVGQQPEIDILEVRGENPHQIIHSYHRSGVPSTSFTTDNGDPALGYADGFHTYGVRWQPGKIEWYIDRQLVQTHLNDAPYQLMYLIANLAVGGDFNFSDVDPSLFPVNFDIDYIRVYQEKDTP